MASRAVITTVDWAEIPGFDGRYFASRDGEVLSMVRKNPRVLSQRISKGGYPAVSLSRANPSVLVHRLIALTFLGEPKSGQVVRHLNGNRLDNRAGNLAWGTASENMWDAVHHGTHHHANQTHCLRGHLLPYEKVRNGGRLQRLCVECRSRTVICDACGAERSKASMYRHAQSHHRFAKVA